ncbi:MAG: hypothetical protein LUB61_05255 [Eggerthellaceae bacterium]|nr:hypothetical protein [Eggerthellaceae bacterium]
MACKVGWHLDDDDFRIVVETHGSGKGIDRPEGVYPDLHMSWQPIYLKSCTFCAARLAKGEGQFCVRACPTFALAYGDENDPDSDYSKALERVRELGLDVYDSDLPDTKSNIVYAQRQ